MTFLETDRLILRNVAAEDVDILFDYRNNKIRARYQGYTFEALSALIDKLHKAYPVWDFISFTAPENEPSMALLKKLGYRDMGYLPARESQVFGK